MPGSWMDGWPPDSKWREYFKDGVELAGEGRCPVCRQIVPAHEQWPEAHKIGPLTFTFHGSCYPAFTAQTAVDPLDWSEPQATRKEDSMGRGYAAACVNHELTE